MPNKTINGKSVASSATPKDWLLRLGSMPPTFRSSIAARTARLRPAFDKCRLGFMWFTFK